MSPKTCFGLANRLKSILLVEQNVVHALQHSTRAYIMETGSVVLNGAGEKLIDNDHIKEGTWEFDPGAGKARTEL